MATVHGEVDSTLVPGVSNFYLPCSRFMQKTKETAIQPPVLIFSSILTNGLFLGGVE